MSNVNNHAPRKRLPLAALAVMALLPLAGCLDDGGSAPTDAAPAAVLAASSTDGRNGEPLTFDGRNSSLPDHTITNWTFDMGDGTTYTITNATEAVVEHAYDAGGIFAVTLTVADANATSDVASAAVATTTLLVAIDQVNAVEATLMELSPLPEGEGRQYSDTINVTEAATTLNVTLDVTDHLPVGQSALAIRFIDPAGDAVATHLVSVDDAATVSLDFAPEVAGDYTLEVEATSGFLAITGTLTADYAL